MSAMDRPVEARTHVRTARLAVLALALLAPVACAHPNTAAAPRASVGAASSRAPASQPAAPSGSPASPATGPATTAQRPSAADQLAAFFSAAQRMDGQIRTAATMINSRIRGNAIHVDASTTAALHAIEPESLVRTIPAGLPSRLQYSVLLVYSDLEARRYAFTYLETDGPRSIPLAEVQRCLAGGATPAARFASDLAAARSLAASLPRVRIPAASDRAGAELALRVQLIGMQNRGCGSCGGRPMTKLATVVWRSGSDGGGHVDGTIDGIPFDATYSAGRGWHVGIHAC